ncbi:MAG: arginyl-tRNA synthetase [Bacteroidetes bacterium]|nr:MAG: arginyl-tRNA synthetase [Bacteroidota bacterium]
MLETILSNAFNEAFQSLYNQQPDPRYVTFQKTRPEFEGDLTIVVFPFTKELKRTPEVIADEIGQHLAAHFPIIKRFNVVKGFLNFLIDDSYWMSFYNNAIDNSQFGRCETPNGKHIVIEYSSPNTNKPLHLGHIRNNLLGWSVAEILKANGYQVTKVNLVNDRGIHICKSMIAWQKWSQKSPSEVGMKGDKLVGSMYVKFDQELKKQTAEAIALGEPEDTAAKNVALMTEAQEMLRQWESENTDVRSLWKTMNNWVYAGFDATYKRLGVDFDKIYYESETYLLGKALVLDGLERNILQKKQDQSIWCDLTPDGLDEKLLLRVDGTSVYMTQDLGTAQQRFENYHPEKMIYVVGNEQNYHFEVLKLVLKKLGKDWAEGIEHLSYGMVELPEGKMKSREGTVVDADDLMDEMINTARLTTEELGKSKDLSESEAELLYQQIGLGALKYFMLKVDPKKTMLFNPTESIDFNGNTGPFIQYTHARIKSIIRKSAEAGIIFNPQAKIDEIAPKEKALLKIAHDFPAIVKQAGENRSPALVANFMYELAKEFNQFYQASPILKEENTELRNFRLGISIFTSNILKTAGNLIGMAMPEKM